jgi:hypothetical protein
MTETKEVKDIVRIKLSEVERESIAFLMKHLACATPQDLFRFLLVSARKEESDNRMRYGGERVSAADKRKAKIEDVKSSLDTLREMTDEDLTAHLVAIGYFTPDGPLDPESVSSERIRADRIITLEGKQYYYQYHFEPGNKKPVYERMVFDIDELIKDLQKEKLI